ncbi:hypothetical protein N7449_006617 [Penicillium cf. viridicatum]|uniref:Uncharacterized protein n=1 Tax=Penicillium cf. viridicatum TaxID=2972119 RepID=A0A9W9JFS1_9EURO|nr:hypothetical protein N7449_006617 [Penicillium cf. viridicatum]
MKACSRPLLSEHGISPHTTIVHLADAIHAIYDSTPSSGISLMGPAFVAAAHEEFKPDFLDLREDNGDFTLDLSGALSEFLSYNDDIEREFEEFEVVGGEN